MILSREISRKWGGRIRIRGETEAIAQIQKEKVTKMVGLYREGQPSPAPWAGEFRVGVG